jgi:transposase
MRGRSHSREFKLEIVRRLASGEKRPAQVCREHNLAASMVARWRQEYDAREEAAFAPPEPTPTQALEAKVAE